MNLKFVGRGIRFSLPFLAQIKERQQQKTDLTMEAVFWKVIVRHERGRLRNTSCSCLLLYPPRCFRGEGTHLYWSVLSIVFRLNGRPKVVTHHASQPYRGPIDWSIPTNQSKKMLKRYTPRYATRWRRTVPVVSFLMSLVQIRLVT
jgi:hypothetical protein